MSGARRGRCPGWVRQSRPTGGPSRILCLSVGSTVSPYDPATLAATETLTQWSATILRSVGGEYERVTVRAGKTSADWWWNLSELCRSREPLWIVSAAASRDWSLLGVWEGVEDGAFIWRSTQTPSRWRTAVDMPALSPQSSAEHEAPTPVRLPHTRAGDGGCIIIGDPPSILAGRLHARPARVTWVDVRNYGIDSVDPHDGSLSASDSLAAQIESITHALSRFGCGPLRATVASQSSAAWRYSYLTHPVYQHCWPEAERVESAAYVGGRCEAYRIGAIAGPVYHLDYRSQYGAIMCDTALPSRLREVEPRPERWMVNRGLRGGDCIADVTVRTDAADYPVRRDGLTIYPTGLYRTCLAGPELQDAIRHGRVVGVHSVCRYHMTPSCAAYARAMYAMRCYGEACDDMVIARFAKRLLVSLPGRLGMRETVWEDTGQTGSDQQYGEWWGSDACGRQCRYRAIAGAVQRERHVGLHSDAQLAMAAWILSAARYRLMQSMRAAGSEHVYYVDTDALMVDATGYRSLVDRHMIAEGVLGMLQLVGVYDQLKILGVKHYVADGRTVCAGLPAHTAIDIGPSRGYQYRVSPVDDIRAGVRPTARLVAVPYSRGGEYRHGTVDGGGVVTPYHIGG